MSFHHLIIGGQRSGKSRHAEHLARQWLAADGRHQVAVVATALAFDDEMRERIARHKADRPPGMDTVEEPFLLSRALSDAAKPGRMLVVDCLTLWLTNWLMPADGRRVDLLAWQAECRAMLDCLVHLPSPVIFVSNEVGLGIIPLSREVREFVDELGRLNQAVAQQCGQVTLMVAGQAWSRPVLKAPAA